MTELFFIKNLNDVLFLPTGWENPILSGYPQIITREGKQLLSGPDCSNYIGRKYQVIAKHVMYYSFCERVSRILKGLLAVISTYGYALANGESRRDLYQLFFGKIKLSKTFAKRYDYNDYLDYYKPFLWKHTPQITLGMIKFLETDPSFEQFKQRCKETGFVVNSDEWFEVGEVLFGCNLLSAIASVSDNKILSYFLTKNRSQEKFNPKTPLLKSVLSRYLRIIQKYSLDVKISWGKIKLLIESGAELNPEASVNDEIFEAFHLEPVLSFFLNKAFRDMKICRIKNGVSLSEDFDTKILSVVQLISTIRPIVHFLLTNKAKTTKEKYPNDDLSISLCGTKFRLNDFFLTPIFVDIFRHERVVINLLQAGRLDTSSGLLNFNNDVFKLIVKNFFQLCVSSDVLTSKFSDSEFTRKLLKARKKANPWEISSDLLLGGKQSLIREK